MRTKSSISNTVQVNDQIGLFSNNYTTEKFVGPVTNFVYRAAIGVNLNMYKEDAAKINEQEGHEVLIEVVK